MLFVRHGATHTTGKVLPGRAPGLHLSETGKQQAHAAGERLAELAGLAANRSPAAIYCSPLERTKETAAAIGKVLGIRPKTHRGLLECDFGSWTGAEISKLAKLPEWQTVQRSPSIFRFPGGESFQEMRSRMVTTVTGLCDDNVGRTVIAVSHADPIKAVVSDCLGMHLDMFQRVVISPCSVSAVSFAVSGPTVLGVNMVGSLRDLVPS